MSMGSVIDTKQQSYAEYTFPLSPPSSTSVTAQSSPRLNPYDPPIVGQLFAKPVFRRANSYTVKSWTQQPDNANVSDSDGSVKATPRHGRASPQSCSLSRLVRNKTSGPLTMSTTRTSHITSPPKATRPPQRRSSCASSSGIDKLIPQHAPANTGIGRKVAASLQLFKDTTPSSHLDDPSSSNTAGVVHGGEEVAEAQFEFVKRSEWPDREAAAVRRERSSTGLSSVRTRNSTSLCAGVDDVEPRKERKTSIRDNVINDLTQWRKDVTNWQDGGRGRRLDRVSDGSTDPEVKPILSSSPDSSPYDAPELVVPPSPFARPHSRAYPLSPSPSRSPLDRIPPTSLPNVPTKQLPISPVYCSPEQEDNSTDNDARSHSRTPTPIQTLSPTPVPTCQPSSAQLPTSNASPLDPMPYSPWSTDDESGWETASATTSTTSVTSPVPPSPSQPHQSIPSDEYDEERQRPFFSTDRYVSGSGSGSDTNALDNSENIDPDLDFSQDSLPHIPLRPFRNQVGGHSAIYKFTKEAVCKVCYHIIVFLISAVSPRRDLQFLSATRVARKFVL